MFYTSIECHTISRQMWWDSPIFNRDVLHNDRVADFDFRSNLAVFTYCRFLNWYIFRHTDTFSNDAIWANLERGLNKKTFKYVKCKKSTIQAEQRHVSTRVLPQFSYFVYLDLPNSETDQTLPLTFSDFRPTLGPTWQPRLVRYWISLKEIIKDFVFYRFVKCWPY